MSLPDAFASLQFLTDRTPATTDAERARAFARVVDYRDGGIFIGHWAGRSPWERHSVGDEIVAVVGGSTTIILLEGDEERRIQLDEGGFVVVPQGVWHRFETPDGVKVLTVTPQPTEHLDTDERPPPDPS